MRVEIGNLGRDREIEKGKNQREGNMNESQQMHTTLLDTIKDISLRIYLLWEQKFFWI